MTSRKFTITDDNGQGVGFLVIEQADVFEYSIPSSLHTDGPIADAALLFASLVGFTGMAWFIPGPSWLAPATGLTVTTILAGIKAWRSGSTTGTNTGGGEMTIKVESWTNEGNVLLDEIRDKTISLDEWRKVGKAVIEQGKNFSRPALSGHISQNTYHKIKAELLRLNMAHRSGNGYTLSPRGLALLRKLNDLPY